MFRQPCVLQPASRMAPHQVRRPRGPISHRPLAQRRIATSCWKRLSRILPWRSTRSRVPAGGDLGGFRATANTDIAAAAADLIAGINSANASFTFTSTTPKR
jgi:hypothetical protein